MVRSLCPLAILKSQPYPSLTHRYLKHDSTPLPIDRRQTSTRLELNILVTSVLEEFERN